MDVRGTGGRAGWAITTAVVLAGAGASGASAAAPATLQGEDLRPDHAAVTWIHHSSQAADGAALAIGNARGARRRVRLTAPVDALVLRARGASCDGAPQAVVDVDGRFAGVVRVPAGRFTDRVVPVVVARGAHLIRVAMRRDARTPSCNRTLYVDRITLRAAAPQPVAVVPAATATPQPLSPGAPVLGKAPARPAPKPAPAPDPVPAPEPEPPPAPAPEPPPTPEPPPAPVPPARAALRWAPPALTSPTTIALANGQTTTKLDNAKDYILKLPAGVKDATTIQGGRNVVIVGGTIKVSATSSSQRAIYIKDNHGTVHIEGVSIDDSGGQDTDGIAIAAPESTVQIENVRITGITGEQSGWHGDVVQPWGGVKDLRIDRLTGRSNYQGLFLRPHVDVDPSYTIGSIALSNIDLAYDNVGAQTGGYLLWLTTGSCTTATAITLSEVHIAGVRSGKSFGTSVWPDVNGAAACRLQTATGGASATWPGLPVLTGSVLSGPAAGGEYVPAGAAGAGYVSPGYAG